MTSTGRVQRDRQRVRSIGITVWLAFATVWSGVSWAADPAPAVDPHAKWEKDIQAFERQDATNPPPRGAILFIGSSSIRLWQTLEQDFPGLRVINRGFGGSEIADSTHFAERIVFPYRPRQIVMYAGTNDINNGKSPEQVEADFRTFVDTVRARFPGIPVAFIAVAGNPARWAQIERVREANARVAAYCRSKPGLTFVNVHDPMLGPDGLPRPEIFVADRLHMNEAGYQIWKRVVGPELLPEPKGDQ